MDRTWSLASLIRHDRTMHHPFLYRGFIAPDESEHETLAVSTRGAAPVSLYELSTIQSPGTQLLHLNSRRSAFGLRLVQLPPGVRRFFSHKSACEDRTFTEQFPNLLASGPGAPSGFWGRNVPLGTGAVRPRLGMRPLA